MIRNKSRDRILSYGINILILIMIISFCGIPNAFATGIKDLIGLTDNDQTLRVELNISYDKLPQFDENRINQLNRILKHISFCGIIDPSETKLSALLDGTELFSVYRKEIDGADRNVLKTEDDRLCIIPEGEKSKSIHQNSIYDFNSVFKSISDNEKIYKSMEYFAAFMEKLPEYFPDQSGTGKTMQKYKDYGTAVAKVTVRISAEDLKSCIKEHLEDFPELCFPDPAGFVFTGRQDFELLMTEEGKALKIRYGGVAGITENDMRTVRLEWKTVRSDTTDKDEMSLRSPDSSGTRRNNFIIEHLRKKQDDGRETFFWKSETDTLKDGIRTRSFLQADAEAVMDSISGSISETVIEKGVTYGNDILFTVTEDSKDQYAGTLEIIGKKDTIESGKMKVYFDFSSDNQNRAADILSAPETVSEKEYTEIRRILISRIVKEIIKLPLQDLVFLTEGIPEETIAQILPIYESVKEPIQ